MVAATAPLVLIVTSSRSMTTFSTHVPFTTIHQLRSVLVVRTAPMEWLGLLQ
jgi:hypothetical protein